MSANARPQWDAPEIETVIADLYQMAETPHPRPERSIAPVGELLSALRLSSAELPALTRRKAEAFLLRWGGLPYPDAVDWADAAPLAGFLYATADLGSLFVEQNDPVTRRRFSAAHELGHYLLHFRPLLRAAGDDWLALTGLIDAFAGYPEEIGPEPSSNAQADAPDSPTVLYGLPPFAQREREADAFAASLLMPADVVAALADIYGKDFQGEDLVWRLSTHMLVSRWAMRRRLRELGLLAPETDEAMPCRN